MENKIKAVLLTIIMLVLAALATYGFTHNVQFIGILLVASFIILISIGLYQTILSVLENKSKNNKNKQS